MAEQDLNYTEDAIKVLEGLEAVRKRPGMYIGSTDTRGLHHLVYEIVDNAIDEVLAGYGEEIHVTINEDNSITVRDFGRGIPTGMHASGRPTSEVVFTVLHAGGKFGDGGYKTSGGLHGVGASVVNALSDKVELEIYRDKEKYVQIFENGGDIISPLKKVGKTRETGTKVTFKPSASVFSSTVYSFTTLKERLRESAFLTKGLKIKLRDERRDKEEIFHFEEGLKAFIDFLNEGKTTLHDVVYFNGESHEIEVNFAFAYTSSYSENILSFVNNVRTRDGGTHETGAKAVITRIFNEFARKTGMIKEKDKNLEGVDIREGLSAIISILVPEHLLQFESQTKSKLGTPDARSAVDAVLAEKLGFFFEENRALATDLIKKAVKAHQAREAARKARDDAREGKSKKKKETNLSGKLTPAQTKNPKKNELFLVEGDSAGGSAKLGRDRKFQAILPLRGKVINTEKAKIDDIFKNEEINTMIHTIGAGFGLNFDPDDVNYDKVIIMTDADTDGAHIQVLLLTFFFRYMRELVEAGKVYIALPPLYKVSKGVGKKAQIEYAWTDEELTDVFTRIKKPYMIQRYKGLGEMNADQLWDTTMNPDTRTLIQVTIEDAADADHRVTTLMGDKVEPRRDWIEQNVDFTMEDDYEI